MDEFKLPEKFAHDPARFRLLKSGAVRDEQLGQIVYMPPGGGKNGYTSETAKAAAQRRKEIGFIAQMRGLALGNGVELPEDAELEELLQKSGDAIVAIYAHTVKTYLQSKNIRGMGEIIPKLVAGFIETDSRAREMDAPPSEMPAIFILFNQYIHQLQEVKNDNSKAVNGEIIE